MPNTLTNYVHRVGRTARAGSEGRSISLIGEVDRKLMRMIVKKTHSKNLKNRVIPGEAIEQCREKVEMIESDIQNILQEEQEEKHLRIAEMEATKASNIIKYEEEINSRPKRTWFQSEREKKILKEKSKNLAMGIDLADIQNDTPSDGKQKPKAAKEQKKAAKKRERYDKQKNQDRQDRDKESLSQKLIAKRAKKNSRLRQQGLLPIDNPEKQKAKKRKTSGASAFDNEMKTSKIRSKTSLGEKKHSKGKDKGKYFKSKKRRTK